MSSYPDQWVEIKIANEKHVEKAIADYKLDLVYREETLYEVIDSRIVTFSKGYVELFSHYVGPAELLFVGDVEDIIIFTDPVSLCKFFDAEHYKNLLNSTHIIEVIEFLKQVQ